MPYKKKSELPDSVRDNLPSHAQDIYRKAFNSAWETYDDPKQRRGDSSREETSHRVAWAAVKNEYEKDEDSGEWKPKAGKKS
jgi:cation transport regulator